MIESGHQIGKYRIVKKLGAGGMADVYLAEDTLMGRHVAMKVLPPEFARDPERAPRFEKEVLHLASLSHPHIVTIYDVGHDGGYHYYTMAQLSGGDLKQRIRDGLSPKQALDILRRMADALGYAHGKGLIHRDIKPQNILFDEASRPYLTDLGIAKAVGAGSQMTKTGMSVGSPHYMSPEQARGMPVDGRSDLYSLGVVLYEMLTGSVPYDAEDTFAVALKHVNDPVPEFPPQLSSYQPLLDRLMAKNPDERFSDASALMEAIDLMQSGQTLVSQEAATRVMPAVTQQTRVISTQAAHAPQGRSAVIKWTIGGIAAAVLIAAGVFYYFQVYLGGQMAGGGAPEVSDVLEQAQDASSPEASSEPVLPQTANGVPETPGGMAAGEQPAVTGKDAAGATPPQAQISSADHYIALSDAAIASHDLDGAQTHLDEAKRLAPDAPALPAAVERLAKARQDKIEADQREAQKAAEAKKRAQEASQQKKRQTFDKHMAAGQRALEANQKTKAIRAFQSALALYADDSEAMAGLEKAQQIMAAPTPGQTYTNTLEMKFVYIPPGTFTRGSTDKEGAKPDETPHSVTLTKGFWMQTMEVTQKQWQALMVKNPSRFSGCDNCPVENVSWHDVQEFIQRLNVRDGKTYRLPTEAEWEYAARAKSQSRHHFGDDDASLGHYACYDANARGKTCPVGQKLPNAWGLHDMLGNVWEWCQDWYGNYPSDGVTNPTGPSVGSARVFRGGAWNALPRNCRSATRSSGRPGNRNDLVGFRLVLSKLN